MVTLSDLVCLLRPQIRRPSHSLLSALLSVAPDAGRGFCCRPNRVEWSEPQVVKQGLVLFESHWTDLPQPGS